MLESISFDLDAIKEVILDQYPCKEERIVMVLAQDENIIPTLLSILQKQNDKKGEVIRDANAELSRALQYIVNTKQKPVKNKEKQAINNSFRKFLIKEIVDFYKKHKGYISNPNMGTIWSKQNKLDL